MEALEILIRKRRRLALDAQIAGIDNFVIEEGEGIDGYELFARHGSMLTPFCLDHARRRMLFSMTPVFALDAETGSRVFRGRDPDLASDEQQRIRSLISLHGRIADPGFILPGTLR